MSLTEAAQNVDDTMGAIEAILVSIVGRAASWVAGVPSAVLVAKSVGRIFDLDEVWAWTIAVSFELIGLTTTSLWATFREWNQNVAKRQKDPKAPEKLARKFVVTYLAIDLLMILILTGTDFAINHNFEIFVGITYPIMTAISVLVMNERIKHRKRMVDFGNQLETEAKEREATKAKKERERATREAEEKSIATAMATMETQRQRLGNLGPEMATLRAYAENPEATQEEIAEIVGCTRRTVGNHLAKLEKAGAIRRNGHGVEVLNIEILEKDAENG